MKNIQEENLDIVADTSIKSLMSGSHALMKSLIEEGVDTIFGYPGGAIMPVYDALYDYRDKVRHILVRHEQGASHAAEGYARVTGKAGVCLATSGPGATNLVTGIADAMIDSIPMVCITGQVTAKLLGTDAFQETDIIGITIPITKWNYQITDAKEVPEVIAKAFYYANEGRPGPVLIDITKNAQIEMMEYSYKKFFPSKKKLQSKTVIVPTAQFNDYKVAAELINNAKKPYIFAGHGVLIAKAEEELKQLVEVGQIPTACTLHGLSCINQENPLYVGMLGMHGNYGPNVLTSEADIVIAIGMRFDDRVTGDVSKFIKDAKVIHIEIDQAEINKIIKADVPLVGDAKTVLNELLPLIQKRNRDEWINEFKECAKKENEKVIDRDVCPEVGQIKMGEVIKNITDLTEGNALVVADVGQHQMSAARYYKFKTKDSWITSGGLGTMGFALPAAFGAKVAAPEREVVAVIGDGSFQMTLQELGTIAQEKIPVKIVILNNQFLGMVRQWQELFFDNRYSFVDMTSPDFIKLADAYGIKGRRVSEREDLRHALVDMLECKESYLLEVMVEKEQNIFPMVPAGKAVTDIRLE